MRLAIAWVMVAGLSFGAVGCQANGSKDRGGVQVEHVVLCWLKQPGDEAAVRRILETSRMFESIPGVVKVRAGRPVPSTRPVVDDSFDVGLLITFEDEAALHGYDQHPTHVKAVREVLRPLAAKILIYDIRRARINEASVSTTPAS